MLYAERFAILEKKKPLLLEKVQFTTAVKHCGDTRSGWYCKKHGVVINKVGDYIILERPGVDWAIIPMSSVAYAVAAKASESQAAPLELVQPKKRGRPRKNPL